MQTSSEFYKENINSLEKKLYFHQDNASCEAGNKSLELINSEFANHFIFPANSPDLSLIKELWSIVEEQLNKYNFNSIETMRDANNTEYHTKKYFLPCIGFFCQKNKTNKIFLEKEQIKDFINFQ